MPTTPIRASVIPGRRRAREEVIVRALEMIANTAPLDVTGHPACSVPAGVVGGLPTGMMIIGKQYDDATVLRVAHTFEQAVGGFPRTAGDRRGGARHERRPRPRRYRRDGPGRGPGERAGLSGRVGEGGLRAVRHQLPGRPLRRRRLPVRDRADAPRGVPDLALLRALGAHRGALRGSKARGHRRGRAGRADAVLPRAPRRAAARPQGSRPPGVRRRGGEARRVGPPRVGQAAGLRGRRPGHRRRRTARGATPARRATSGARPA